MNDKKQKKTITIQLRKGLMGCTESQRKTITGLGFKKRMQQKTLENTPSIRGMIKKVIHLLDIVQEN